jgi:N-acylglucosamine-6-phosphate 2-epimerase
MGFIRNECLLSTSTRRCAQGDVAAINRGYRGDEQMPFPLPRGAFAVSCQARADNPLHGPAFMAAMAQAAEQGGAAGFRVNGADDIRAVRAVSALPIIGLVKRFSDHHPIYITPDVRDAVVAASAGATLIAIDATPRARDGLPLGQLIPAINAATGCAVMADIATLDDGLAAARYGADAIATTLAGHTPETAHRKPLGPDLDLVSALVAATTLPIVAEGLYETPEQVAEAFLRGAYAVVVGTAITNPREITRRFVQRSGAKA